MPIDIARPADNELAPYFGKYVDAAADALARHASDNIADLLATQTASLRALLANTDASRAHVAYAPGKWTLAESLLHVADTERVFSYRMLRIARGDQTPLAGFDQDAWVPHSRAGSRTMADILDEIETVRRSTLSLVHSLDEAAVVATGTSNGVTVSVRALVWIIAGHFAHHLQLTADRYVGNTGNS